MVDAEETKPKRISVITANEIDFTGRVSFKFMFDSGAPHDHTLPFPKWGYMSLDSKSSDHLDVWEWAKMQRGEEHGQTVGDNGVGRWNINLFQPGNEKPSFIAGFDDDEHRITTLQKLIGDDLPDCVILMHKPLFGPFKAACDGLEDKVVLLHHHFEGTLSTS
jgi:hypothetical protein